MVCYIVRVSAIRGFTIIWLYIKTSPPKCINFLLICFVIVTTLYEHLFYVMNVYILISIGLMYV